MADCLEGADEDDERWLDAAIAVHRWIAHSMPGDMRDEMLQVISAVRPAYRLSPSETQRIEALVGDRTPTERAYDDPPTERGEQFAYVENLLRTQIRFEDEYAALSSE